MDHFGNNYVTITDEEGVNYELEHLFTFDCNGEDYAVFLPAGEGNAEDNEMILLHVIYDGNSEEYENIPEDIYEDVYAKFMDKLFEEE